METIDRYRNIGDLLADVESSKTSIEGTNTEYLRVYEPDGHAVIVRILLVADKYHVLSFLQMSPLPELYRAATADVSSEDNMAYDIAVNSEETRRFCNAVRGAYLLATDSKILTIYKSAADIVKNISVGTPSGGDDAPHCSEDEYTELVRCMGIKLYAEFNFSALCAIGAEVTVDSLSRILQRTARLCSLARL